MNPMFLLSTLIIVVILYILYTNPKINEKFAAPTDPLTLIDINSIQNEIYRKLNPTNITEVTQIINDFDSAMVNIIDKQKNETQFILNSVQSTINDLKKTQTLLENEITLSGRSPPYLSKFEGFVDLNKDGNFNFAPVDNNSNKNADDIPKHQIVTKQHKSMFSTIQTPPNMNNYNEMSPNWKLEWTKNLQDVMKPII